MAKYSIGADFGTLSCRALLADAATGKEIAAASNDYKNAVIDETMVYSGKKLPPDYALQHPADYLESLEAEYNNQAKGKNLEIIMAREGLTLNT